MAPTLIAAATVGDLEILKDLIQQGASVEASIAQNGKTALHFASERGHVSAVDLLVKSGANVDKLDATGQSALYTAAVNNRLSVVQLLIDQGADVDLPENAGMTPLHTAAKLGRLSMVQFLCEQCAEVDKVRDTTVPASFSTPSCHSHSSYPFLERAVIPTLTTFYLIIFFPPPFCPFA